MASYVISYTGRFQKPNEQSVCNYNLVKLELLALKWAVTEKLRDYLLGSKFVVYTSENPLAYVNSN